MSSAAYDDTDAGDISLSLSGMSLPSFGAGPSRSARPTSSCSSSGSASRSRERHVHPPTSASVPVPASAPAAAAAQPLAPAPQRLFGKALFGLAPSPETETKPTFARRSSATPIPSGDDEGAVSLNDDDVDTPLAVPSPGPSFWGGGQSADMPNPRNRPASANPSARITRRISASPTPHFGTAADDPGVDPLNIMGSANGGSGGRPLLNNRRTSSTLGRSRSLNVRLPSVDLSSTGSKIPTRSPMSATTARATPSSKIGWSRRPGEPRPPPLVSESVSKGMSRWIKEVVVCNFDLERGPVVERRAGGRRWGPGEKENVAFSSFPDTSLFTEGSILFSFKIRHIPPDPSSLSQPEPPSPMPDRVVKTVEEELLETTIADPPGEADVQTDENGHLSPKALTSESSAAAASLANAGVNTGGAAGAAGGSGSMSTGEKAAEYRLWDERGREWLYGYVWFEQRRDKGITRGYMQKSLVILTHLPFPALFAAILQRVAPVFFEYGYSALEAACHSIATWPDPIADTILELPLMSHVITTKLPDMGETPQVGLAFGISSPSPSKPLLASLPTSTPLRAFASFLPALWSLWECLILAEPVLVIAPDPKTCSEIVWWLREMMRPIPPAGDFRPYLHIHDHDFSLLVNSNKPQPGVVVGVTNPFFRNAASHWPNVISIASQRPRRMVSNGVSPGPAPPTPSKLDQPEGFISRRHRSVQKDRALLKRLEALVAEGKLDDPEANEALRTHFQRLTERFLVPLNRYFQTLVPTLSPSPTPPPISPLTASAATSSTINGTGIRPFSLPTFLSHLRTHGPNPLAFRTKGLSTKARVENDFYASFCMSATFARWLAARVETLGLAVAQNTQHSSSTGNNLTVPGNGTITPTRLSPLSTDVGFGSAPNTVRPSLSRKASVGLGISSGSSGFPPTEGRRSPVPATNLVAPSVGGSESERSRLSSEADDDSIHWRQSHDEPTSPSLLSNPFGFGSHNGRGGGGGYAYVGESHNGRRASEGFVMSGSKTFK